MTAAKKPVDWQTVTVRAKSKMRFVVIDDAAAIGVMRAAGKRFATAARVPTPQGFRFDAAYALPSYNVAEIFTAEDGRLRAYLFSNLDVWMSFADE